MAFHNWQSAWACMVHNRLGCLCLQRRRVPGQPRARRVQLLCCENEEVGIAWLCGRLCRALLPPRKQSAWPSRRQVDRGSAAQCLSLRHAAPIHPQTPMATRCESDAASTCRTPDSLCGWPEAQHTQVRTGPILSGHDHRCLSQQKLTMLGPFVWTQGANRTDDGV